ncbi:MAG: acetolactate synthase, partial [Candidatus Methylomirabilis sp.]|nr:acetolactate synthase [Deltaproteobacteria bacterium]
EQAAAHCAEGWARVTGKAGVALVTAGPGVTDAVTGAANAYRGSIPMVLIGGQGPRMLQDMGSLQDMNHVELMRPITKWSVSIPETRRVAEYISMAFRRATTGVPGPVFLEFPLDLTMDMVDDGMVEFPTQYRTEARTGGDPAYIEKAAELLGKAERAFAVVGSQLWWSPKREILKDFAARYRMPIFLNGQGRGALRPDDPHFLRRTRKEALQQGDLALIFGTPLDFRLGYGRRPTFSDSLRTIQIDLDGAEIGRNRAIDVGIVGDTGLVMQQIMDATGGKKIDFSPFLKGLREAETARNQKMMAERASDAFPINPLRLCHEMNECLTEDSIVVGDGGDIVATGANVFDIYKQGHWMDPGPLGTLGVGPSYAISAKLANPDKPVFVLFGDGSFGLNGMEYESAARQKIPFVGVCGNDAAWMQIRRGQIELYGEAKAVATSLDYTRYDKMVEALGGHGEWVEHAKDIRPAIERAIASGKPALVNVKMGASEFRKGAISV